MTNWTTQFCICKSAPFKFLISKQIVSLPKINCGSLHLNKNRLVLYCSCAILLPDEGCFTTIMHSNKTNFSEV